MSTPKEREKTTLILAIPRKNHETNLKKKKNNWFKSHSYSWMNHCDHWLVCSTLGTEVESLSSKPEILNRNSCFAGREVGDKHQSNNYQMTISPAYINLFLCFWSLVFFPFNKFWLLCIIYITQWPVQHPVCLPTERENKCIAGYAHMHLYMYKHSQPVTKW